MEALLQAEPAWFVPLKLAITAVGVLLLVLHKNFSLGPIPALKLLYGLPGLYGCLVAYEGVCSLRCIGPRPAHRHPSLDRHERTQAWPSCGPWTAIDSMGFFILLGLAAVFLV
jgi:hypothetical protein